MSDERPEISRERLLDQVGPSPERLERYQRESRAMLDRMERGLRREKWGVGAYWFFAVAFMTASLMAVGLLRPGAPELLILGVAFTILVVGAVEIVKHFVNRSRVEILKELKALESRIPAPGEGSGGSAR